MASQDKTSLRELSLLFLRLGTVAFGGPAAHIAMMQDEVVQRRQWLTEEHFLDLLGATNLIPGPNSTEMAIHIGWQRRRWAGLVVAGVSFIVPAALITGVLAWAYVRFGTVPAAAWLLYGVKPVILAVVAQAIWRLAPKAAGTWRLRVLGVIAAALTALGANELLVLLGAGAAAALLARLAGTDGRRHSAARTNRDGRSTDLRPRRRGCAPAYPLQSEFHLARARRGSGGLSVSLSHRVTSRAIADGGTPGHILGRGAPACPTRGTFPRALRMQNFYIGRAPGRRRCPREPGSMSAFPQD